MPVDPAVQVALRSTPAHRAHRAHRARRVSVALAGPVLAGAAALGVAAGLFAGAATADTPDRPDAPNGPRANLVRSGPLVDLDPAIGPFDGARATVSARQDSRRSDTVKLSVTGARRNGATATYGAHLHTGPCLSMNGAAAGPHLAVAAPPSPRTEVWLDLALDSDGQTETEVTVPFVLPPGSVGSVVIHARPTAADGTAGARVACLPVRF